MIPSPVQHNQAKAFIASLKTQTLSKYRSNPSEDATVVLLESCFAESLETTAASRQASRDDSFGTGVGRERGAPAFLIKVAQAAALDFVFRYLG